MANVEFQPCKYWNICVSRFRCCCLFTCCLDIWSIFRNTILLMLVVKRLKPAKARVWFTKNVASWRSQYSLLKHYSSPVSLTCHFPQCVFAAKPHHGGQYLLHIWHKIKVHEPFYKLRIFFAGLYFGSFTLPANKQTLGSYSFWPWRSPIEYSSFNMKKI